MLQAAEDMEFERAAALRDKLLGLRDKLGETVQEEAETYQNSAGKGRRRNRGGRKKVPRPKRG